MSSEVSALSGALDAASKQCGISDDLTSELVDERRCSSELRAQVPTPVQRSHLFRDTSVRQNEGGGWPSRQVDTLSGIVERLRSELKHAAARHDDEILAEEKSRDQAYDI